MSRRSGQSGSVEKNGSFYVVRFWQDIAGQEKRTHRSVRICPVSGPGSMTKPEREHRAREIIQESGADTAAHFHQVMAVNLRTTFRQQAEWWIQHMQDRRRKPVKPLTVSSWKSHLRWINPRLGDASVSNVNNLALKGLVSEMADADFTPKADRIFQALRRASCFPKIRATIATATHRAAAYTAYHNASCPAFACGGLKTTSDPVELACMNWDSKMLLVLVYTQAISTLIAVIAPVNAKK